MDLLEENQEQRLTNCAVYVQNGCKYYGRGYQCHQVLDGFNISVRQGEIYGLLGASGCGKTTLLSCIIGVETLNSGDIWVLGGRPRSASSKSPGSCVGYQPQQNALYAGFTIAETFKFFGWLCGLDGQQVAEKTASFQALLNLTSIDQTVASLSGGEQKRVSLAVALLSDPELLVLDEPTVGVDAVLRDNIWKHLRYMVESSNTTVIISTHYIEEAKLADTIGFMRGGRLLVQCSPTTLLNSCQAENLEDAFVKMCYRQTMSQNRTESYTISTDQLQNNTELTNTTLVEWFSSAIGAATTSSRTPAKYRTSPATHMKAMLWKNGLWMWRHSAIVISLMIAYSMLLHLIGVSVGRNPSRVSISVVNLELHEFKLDQCSYGAVVWNSTSMPLSCEYLRILRDDVFDLTYYNSTERAKQQVLATESWAMVVIGPEFSKGLNNRLNDVLKFTPNSSVDVYQDMSVEPIAHFVQKQLVVNLQNFLTSYAESLDQNPKLLRTPLNFKPPVFGSYDITLMEFIVPGVISNLIYLVGISIACVTLFIEKTEQIEDRLTALGVETFTLLTSHFLIYLCIIIVQTVLLLVTFYTMESHWYMDHLLDMGITILLPGICGLCTGFFLSSLCKNETQVMCMVIGIVLPIFLVSGGIWPKERMHWILTAVSPWLPIAKSSDSLRALTVQNLTLSDRQVFEGALSSIVWIGVLVLSTSIMVFLKKIKLNR